MMPVIRISDETWEKLQRLATPLQDSADDVIGRAADIALAQQSGTKRKTSPKIVKRTNRSGGPVGKHLLPQKEFEVPLLKTLYELGGSAPTKQVRPIMEKKMKDRLREDDHRLVATGEPRWWNAICWARNELVKDGRMQKGSPRGLWELSEMGVKFIEGKLR